MKKQSPASASPPSTFHLPPSDSNPKVAIVHDWLIGGGAELVVEQLHKLYPDTPIYTSYCTDEWRKRLDNKVVTGWLQHLGKVRKFIPFLRIWWFTHLDLSGYDLIISSSGAEAKGIKVGRWKMEYRIWQNIKATFAIFHLPSSIFHPLPTSKAIHIAYIHAPTHYYWSRYDEYMDRPGFGRLDSLARLGLKLLVGPLRKWDYKAAQRPDYIIANSNHTRNEIKKYYNRDAVVIHPPVYFDRFQKPKNQHLPRKGFIISGRQTPYKRFDIAIMACSKLNVPLTVIGDGPDRHRLESLAGPTVKFLGKVSDTELEKQFASAEALIFPGLDDFGITPVEALAAGTPVIAYRAGGALDYVQEGVNGLFFNEQTPESLLKTLHEFKSHSFDPKSITKTAQEFSTQSFRIKIQVEIKKLSPN